MKLVHWIFLLPSPVALVQSAAPGLRLRLPALARRPLQELSRRRISYSVLPHAPQRPSHEALVRNNPDLPENFNDPPNEMNKISCATVHRTGSAMFWFVLLACAFPFDLLGLGTLLMMFRRYTSSTRPVFVLCYFACSFQVTGFMLVLLSRRHSGSAAAIDVITQSFKVIVVPNDAITLDFARFCSSSNCETK